MERAVELARQGRGPTAPNPCVGAVLVHDGRIVAEAGTPASVGFMPSANVWPTPQRRGS